MSYTLAIKNREGKFQRFTVPFEVSLYVKQLEAYIMLPGISKLKKAYPERFAEAPDLLATCKEVKKIVSAAIAKAERDIKGDSSLLKATMNLLPETWFMNK